MGQIIVRPQLQGILQKEAFQRSPQASALDSFNFWPIDPKTGRNVPGTRPKFVQLDSVAGTVTMLEGVNGKSGSNPFNSFATIIAGTLYYWNGSSFTAATGAQATGNDSTRNVSAAPFVNQLVITKASAKPIIFDYPTGVATTVVETAGTAPSDARIVVNWQGTVWLTARQDDPHVLYAPRVGDLTDWDYSVDPTDQFGAFFTDSETEGKLSGPVTALMPQTSDTMIVSTFEGLLAMRGHPRQGGVFETVNKGRYVLGQGAWCRIPGDILLFLTPIGIMSLEPSPNASPALFSKEKMPEELIGLSYSYADPTVTMVYDNRWNQVHLFNRGTFEQGWTLDLGTGGFHRISAQSYPYCVTAFPSFDSEQSSGTLFGRYDGIHYFDKFGTETISAGFTLNPVQLSQSTMSKAHINAVRVILGRNSPSSDLNGSMRMAVGIDAQDAASKALACTFDYEVDLQVLKRNNGMCYPKQSGQSVVFNFTHQGGDVSIEEIHMDVTEAGFNRKSRSEQFAADGEETNFNENLTALDVTQWTGYQQGIPQVSPDTTLTDFTHFLDLSLMDATWWATVAVDGRDIRVSTTANVEVPVDLVYFNYADQEGFLTFKKTQTTTPVALRVWCGNPEITPPDEDNEFGQYNAYDDNWRAFYPDGALVDRTQYQNTRTVIGGTAGTIPDGPIGGAPATDYNNSIVFGDEAFIADNSLEANLTWTIITAAKKTAATTSGGQKILMALYDGSGLTGFHSLDYSTGGTTFSVTARTSGTSGDTNSTISAAGTVTAWNHYAGVWDGLTSRLAHRNGVAGTLSTTSNSVTLVKSRAPMFDNYAGQMALSQIHDIARTTAWVEYQAAMMDQATFWGSFDAFVQVNTPHVVTFNPVACPSGVITPVETGTWSGYAAATPDTPSDSILDVLHLIDLSALPVDWWSAVASDGVDIRATDHNNVFLPLDLVDFDSTADTGFAVVRQNQYVSGATEIRLWVGNATAIAVSPCSLYGQYNVYEPNIYGFWPGGSGEDRTQWLNDTATLTPSGTGPAGNKATEYTGTIGALANTNIPVTVPFTLIAAAKIQAATLFADETLLSITGEVNDSGVVLKTSAAASPARLVMRRPTGTEIIAGNTATITAGDWWLQSGVAVGTTQRRVLVNGGGTPESTIEGATVSSLTRATIGAQTLPDDTTFNNFNGDISLVQIHAVAKADAWVDYQSDMLTQSTFWNTWAWTASSSALPQP
jgi:hypothetical protein